MTFHVAYACNETYKEQTMISILSLCSNCREDDIKILLIEDGMKKKSLTDMRMLVNACERHMEIIPLHALLGSLQLGNGGRHPHTIYAKLFLADICHAERILYLDSDTVVLGPLTPLINMDMENVYIAGVKMPYSIKKKASVRLDSEKPYLCDGILLMNLEKWRRDHLTQKCVSYINRCGGNPPMLSEGTLNYAAQGFVKVLPPEYNLMSGMIRWSGNQLAVLYGVDDYYREQELIRARKYPVIIHYLDELYIRPWYQNSDHPYRKYYRQYFRIIEKDWKKQADQQNSLKDVKRTKILRMEKRRRIGTLRVRTLALRLMDHFLPFWIFSKIYRVVKG